jgi:two-component system sensor histidine kinase VicK
MVLTLVDEDFARVDTLEEIKLQSTRLRAETFEYQHEVFEGELAELPSRRVALNAQIEQLKAKGNDYSNLLTSEDSSSKDDSQAITTAIDAVVASVRDVVDITGVSSSLEIPEAAEKALISAQDKLDVVVDKVLSGELKNTSVADAEIDTTVGNLQKSVIILAITITTLALAMGVGVGNWVAKSLERVKRGAQYIANGDFSHPIAITSKDEVGQLGVAFNAMAERLKEAYHRQAVAQQRDQAMLLSMGEGLIAIDESGKIALINKIATEMLDMTGESAGIGKSIPDAYKLYTANDTGDEPLPTSLRPSYIALTNGTAVNDIYGFRKVDGTRRLLNITATPVKLADKVVGVITVLRDVTKEREVDRMKTEFISLASHQLRTPLSAIKWFSEMLVAGDAGKLEPEQLDFAKNIASSTERMIDLVNALLNISRIESGRIVVDPKPTDLKELVSGIINDLKGKTEEKQQTLVISVHADLPKINLDPRLIGQVYLNLLTNAIKYTPQGGEISVFVSRKDDQIISQVTDNGYGIPKEQQDRVFQKFFRAANAVKVETDGTGLGLYLIKTVVESSGGKIWFESEEGKGTTFWFSMPASGMIAKEGEVTLDV